MEDTYANLDSNEPTCQTRNDRGSSSSKKRLYLQVIIFLGILNVVLLVGLIALSIHSRYLAARLSDIKDSPTEDKLSATLKAILSEMVRNQQFSGGWNCSAAPQQFPAAQIDAGQGMVVMTDRNSNTFYLNGSSWSKLGSVPLKHVSVGPSGIWGVNQQNRVYKFVGSDFVPTRDLDLKQVDAGGQGQVVGVASNDNIYCLNANRASSIKELMNWSTFNGRLIYFSCAPTGCWGVNAEQMINFTKISNSCDITGGWKRMDGEAVNVEVGSDGNVFVVNQSGVLYERIDISGGVPEGKDWKKIEMPVKVKHASYDLGFLWLVTETGFILKCTK